MVMWKSSDLTENTTPIMKDQELVDQLQPMKKIQKNMNHSLDLYDMPTIQNKKKHSTRTTSPVPPLHFGGVFV